MLSMTSTPGDTTAQGEDGADADPAQDQFDAIGLREAEVEGRRNLRTLPTLVRDSVLLVWRAAPAQLVLLGALALLQAGVITSQVLLARRVLGGLGTLQSDGTLGVALVVPLALLAASVAVTALIGGINAQRSRAISERVQLEVESEIMRACGAVGLLAYESPAFYNHLRRVQSNATQKPLEVTRALLALVTGIATASALGAALLGLSPLLLPLMALFGLPLMALNRATSKAEFRFQVRQSESYRERYYLSETLMGRPASKEVRAFGLADALGGRWRESYHRYLGDLGTHLRRRDVLAGLAALVTGVGAAAALTLLVVQIKRGSLGLADAGAALIAARLFSSQALGLLAGLASLYEASLFLGDYSAFVALADDLDACEDDEDAVLAPPVAPLRELEVRDLSFTYPGAARTALSHVDLQIRQGEVVALVGENGSGKSTLAKIIAGLYPATSGTVEWNGADVTTLDQDSLREQIALIFQDFVQYQLPAADNISVGRTEFADDRDRVREAARMTGADAFLSRLPQGYDTYLSRAFRNGQDLSLGQWQRVAIARAFFRDAPLVILDEPSAALDARAEHDLFDRLRQMLAGRTVLFISHRFSTVRQADRIIVLKDGGVVASGSHDQLMAEGGLYAELFTLQAGAYLA